MKSVNRKSIFILLAVLFSLFIIVAVVNADFYVVAGSRAAGTEIRSLPYTITSSGFYYITKNLTCTTGDQAIRIEASDVTLDLMGFSIIGPGSGASMHGIYMHLVDNVEIRNGTVRSFTADGVQSNGTIDHFGMRIMNLRVHHNGQYGIYLDEQNHIVQGCTVSHNSYIGIDPGDSSKVIGNTIFKNGNDGIEAGRGCTITGNTSYDNASAGITGNVSVFSNNTCFDNDNSGIVSFSYSTVIGNTCYRNGGNGINAGNGSTITSNTCSQNTLNGIEADVGSTIIGNTCYDNSDSGIHAQNGSTLTSNTCNNNTEYGIELGLYCMIHQNTCLGNGVNMSTCATCVGSNVAP